MCVYLLCVLAVYYMKDFIKQKRLTFAEEIGVASKSTAKPLDVGVIKPQVVKLMEIKFEPRHVVEIHSRVEATTIKTAAREGSDQDQTGAGQRNCDRRKHGQRAWT